MNRASAHNGPRLPGLLPRPTRTRHTYLECRGTGAGRCAEYLLPPSSGAIALATRFRFSKGRGRLMTTATMFPDLAVGFAEKMANTFDAGRIEELTSDQASTAIRACAFLQDLFAQGTPVNR